MDNAAQNLYEMCESNVFNIEEAQSLIAKIDLNKTYSETCFLHVAVANQNIKMVELLLQNGADPNLIVNSECALWDLQYNVYSKQEYEKNPESALQADRLNLKIAQVLLEYGADTNIAPEGEGLFSYVLHKVFNDFDSIRLSEYRTSFFILLIAYGGQDKYCKPEIIVPFDKSKMAQYIFSYVKSPDNYHLRGEISDTNHNIVARI